MVGYLLRHQLPESGSMIELREMTKFVHDDVVLQMLWQEEYFVAEVEILERSTASPTRLRIPYAHTVVGESVYRIPVFESLQDMATGDFFMFSIVLGHTTSSLSSSSYDTPHIRSLVYQKRPIRVFFGIYHSLSRDNRIAPTPLHRLHPRRALLR